MKYQKIDASNDSLAMKEPGAYFISASSGFSQFSINKRFGVDGYY